MLALHLVLRHHMERGFATRLLQHGPVLVAKGAAGAARFSAFATCVCARGNRRATCSRSIWFCATKWNAGLQPAPCNTGRCLWQGRSRRCAVQCLVQLRREASRMLAVHLVYAAKIISLAFSAIMIVGALVLPDIKRGITEASTTRKPVTPITRNWGSTTAIASRPILAVPTG
jgi:hypothetical protein